MSLEHILVERQGPLTVVTINRPSSHNALNAAAQDEMEKVFDDFAADDGQWVAIVTGAGEKAFCAGMDLKEQAAGGKLEAPSKGFGGLAARFDLSKPVIAAVNGVAMGGGFELALACDLVIASHRAVFALPEPRVGLAALGGGIQRLPHEIGLKRAMGMMLTGRRLGAGEALQFGIVNEVTDGDVLEAAKRWAGEILACSPMSVRATKEAVMRGLSISIEEGIAVQWQYPAMQAMLTSADFIEGPSAFAEKRAPNWQGR